MEQTSSKKGEVRVTPSAANSLNLLRKGAGDCVKDIRRGATNIAAALVFAGAAFGAKGADTYGVVTNTVSDGYTIIYDGYILTCNGTPFMAVAIREGPAVQYVPFPTFSFGASWSAQPFMGDMTTLGYTSIDSIKVGRRGVTVDASGCDSAWSSPFGEWYSSYTFSYNPTEKLVSGSGSYTIKDPSMIIAKYDLYLFQINSSYLLGTSEDTEGTYLVDVVENNKKKNNVFVWNPITQPSYFPACSAKSISILSPSTADEPSLGVTVTSPNKDIGFVGYYYTNDTVSPYYDYFFNSARMMPYVEGINYKTTSLSFEVEFESQAP